MQVRMTVSGCSYLSSRMRISRTIEKALTVTIFATGITFFHKLDAAFNLANVLDIPVHPLPIGSAKIPLAPKTGSGSHYALAWETKPKDTWTSRLYHRIEFMSRRDYYVFAWMVLAFFGWVTTGIVLMFATTVIVFGHETLRPRQAREDFMLQPPTG